MYEMERRGYEVRDKDWWNRFYRGKSLGYADGMKFKGWYGIIIYPNPFEERIYPEHDEKYLDECIANLAAKGVKIDRDVALTKMTKNRGVKYAG